MDRELARRFGANLRAHRHTLGHTLLSLGETIGLTGDYLGSIERGERNLELSSIQNLCTLLDVDPSTLFAVPGSATAPGGVQPAIDPNQPTLWAAADGRIPVALDRRPPTRRPPNRPTVR